MLEFGTGIFLKKSKQKINEYRNNPEKLTKFLKKTKEEKEYMEIYLKEYRKNLSKNALKKIRENVVVKSVGVDLIIKFIKSGVYYLLKKIIMMMFILMLMILMMNKKRSLESDRICVISNGMFSSRYLIVDSAAFWHTINFLLKECYWFCYEYMMVKEVLQCRDIEI